MATRRTTTAAASAFEAAATRRRAPQQRPAPPAPGTTDRRKYTIRIDPAPADRFERAVLQLTVDVGRKLDKSEVMRELLDLFVDDPAVAASVVDRLRRR
jgi:hypothetical protein